MFQRFLPGIVNHVAAVVITVSLLRNRLKPCVGEPGEGPVVRVTVYKGSLSNSLRGSSRAEAAVKVRGLGPWKPNEP